MPSPELIDKMDEEENCLIASIADAASVNWNNIQTYFLHIHIQVPRIEDYILGRIPPWTSYPKFRLLQVLLKWDSKPVHTK